MRYLLKSILLIQIALIAPIIAAKPTKPWHTWLKQRYDLFRDDLDGITANFLERRKVLDLPETATTRKADEATVKEFRSWVKSNKSQTVFENDQVVVLKTYVFDALNGNILVKRPAVLIKQNDDWTEFNAEIIEVMIFDLDGDKKPDIYYETGCCGGRAAGALILRSNQPPIQTDTAGWSEIYLQPSKSQAACSDSEIPARTPFSKTGFKKGACDAFKIELSFSHCSKSRKAQIIFNCMDKNFDRKILPP